jgi:hypothetical protein
MVTLPNSPRENKNSIGEGATTTPDRLAQTEHWLVVWVRRFTHNRGQGFGHWPVSSEHRRLPPGLLALSPMTPRTPPVRASRSPQLRSGGSTSEVHHKTRDSGTPAPGRRFWTGRPSSRPRRHSKPSARSERTPGPRRSGSAPVSLLSPGYSGVSCRNSPGTPPLSLRLQRRKPSSSSGPQAFDDSNSTPSFVSANPVCSAPPPNGGGGRERKRLMRTCECCVVSRDQPDRRRSGQVRLVPGERIRWDLGRRSCRRAMAWAGELSPVAKLSGRQNKRTAHRSGRSSCTESKLVGGRGRPMPVKPAAATFGAPGTGSTASSTGG